MTVVVYSLVPVSFLRSEQAGESGRLTWKFLVVETADETVLLAGPVSQYPYHADLIEQFCDRHEIPCSWVRKPDLLEVYDPDVNIRGGGHILIDCPEHRMKLGGRSTAYGAFDPGDLAEIVRADSFFEGFEVEIVGGSG